MGRGSMDAGPEPASTDGRWLVIALVALGIGAALVAVLGPLVIGAIEYHASDGAVDQIVGGDVAGLVLVAPVSIIAGVLVWRRRLLGPVLALGPAAYGLYMYSQLALGGDVARYPGNSERYFLLYLGLFVLAAGVLVRAWSMFDTTGLPRASRRLDKTLGVFLLVVAAFLTVGLHLPGLVDAWKDQPTSPEYLADPVIFWLVKFMDLGLVVPSLLVVGVGVLRGSSWIQKRKYAMVGWSALLGSSVAGMAVVMQVKADPAATTANTIAFTGFAVIALAIAWVAYRPLLGLPNPGQEGGGSE